MNDREVIPNRNRQSVPDEFVPFQTYKVGTNKLLHGRTIFTVDGFPPLLIGKAKAATEAIWIWLFRPENGRLESWIPVVVKNVSQSGDLHVNSAESTIQLLLDNTLLLDCEADRDADSVQINYLNLFPLNLAIRSDRQLLRVSGTDFRRNIFDHADSMVALAG